MNLDTLRSTFDQPGAAWRGKPFWSWNGDLKEEEMVRQIDVLRTMGMGGFFMHSRTGLATEYLGEEWMRLTNRFADHAEALGMEAWLYDEDRWPSGTAGGRVTLNPEFRRKYLSAHQLPAAEFIWSDDLLAAFACELEGVDLRSSVRIGKDTPAAQYAGKQIVTFIIEDQQCDSFYNGTTYVDTMNRAATERFIELTHEKYRTQCGDRLGRSIKGIFTDEPHRGALLCGFAVGNENRMWMTPWTASLFDDFKQAFGYDLLEKLPELYFRPQGQDIAQVKWHYVELLQRLFLKNFAEPCLEWCSKNNMILTGHVLHEDALACQTAVSGSMMRYYEHMHWPGIDLLTEGNQAYWVAKQLQSAARQMGQPWLLSELYGCTGWQMPLQGHKWVGDWQALFGINVRCHHLSWYTMEGESKRDYPASIFHHSAWWKDYAAVETYFARFGVLQSTGKPACDVLVLNPIETMWAQVRVGWAEVLSSTVEKTQRLEANYANLFHWLQGAQIDFDYGDEEMLSRLAAVETEADGTPVLRVGQMRYRTVVCALLETMRGSTLKLVEQFMAAGGKVVFAGPPPTHLDALPSPAPATLAAKGQGVAFEREALTQAVAACAPPAATVTDPATGEPCWKVFTQVRDGEGYRTVLALSVDREQPLAAARVRIQAPAGIEQPGVEEWDCLTGKRQRIPATLKDGVLEFQTSFAVAGDRAFIVRPAAQITAPARVDTTTSGRVELAGPYAYRLSEPNVCVLDYARWRHDGGAWQPAQEILKVDRAVRELVGLPARSGEMLQPWFVKERGVEAKGRVELEFCFGIETLPTLPVELVLERPDLFSVTINGQLLEPNEVRGWWIDKVFQRIPVPAAALHAGKNVVTLGVDFHENINLEAIYLLGAFGVRLEASATTDLAAPHATLTTLPALLEAGDLADQGLPFYSGTLVYQATLPRELAGRQAVLTLPQFEAACAKLLQAGQTTLMPWRPYEAPLVADTGAIEIELVLTRRNTFGPLHIVPLHPGVYGPAHFVLTGENWTDAYTLWPSGLLGAPVVEVRQPIRG